MTALAAVAAGLVPLTAAAEFSGPDWRYYKPIQVPASLPEGALVELAPDRDVFARAASGLTDLRIVEAGSQREEPYKLLVERGEQRRAAVEVGIRDLGHVPGQYTSFVVDMKREGVLHNELEVKTSSQNFQRRVTVEGSADGQAWAVLREGDQIFDFTVRERGFSERINHVRYPETGARYLRVRIQNGDEPPLEITGAVVYFNQALASREAELSASVTKREEDAENRRTLLFIDLGLPGTPHSRIVLATSQQNFYRQVSLAGSDDAETWVSVLSSDVVYGYNTPKFVGSKLALVYPETTYRHLRLTIANEDNPPLPVSGIQAFGVLRKIIFATSPGATYNLYYGRETARAPSYEFDRIFPYLVTENLPVARLQAHAANPLFAIPPPPPVPFTEKYPWLLPSVVAVAGVFLGAFLANLLRQVRKLLPPPAPPA